jgi:hypothetical protein
MAGGGQREAEEGSEEGRRAGGRPEDARPRQVRPAQQNARFRASLYVRADVLCLHMGIAFVAALEVGALEGGIGGA